MQPCVLGCKLSTPQCDPPAPRQTCTLAARLICSAAAGSRTYFPKRVFARGGMDFPEAEKEASGTMYVMYSVHVSLEVRIQLAQNGGERTHTFHQALLLSLFIFTSGALLLLTYKDNVR